MRHYGFLSPNSKLSVEAVRWLVTIDAGQLFLLLSQSLLVMAPPPRLRCPECGGPLCVVGLILPGDALYFDTS